MNEALLRSATSTCEQVGSSTECVYQYVQEITYLDWLLVQLFIIALLALPALGFFMRSLFSAKDKI